MSNEERIEPLHGHLCERLEAFQKRGGGCVPNFHSDGTVRGCDDENPLGQWMRFCPFCGEALKDWTEPKKEDSDDE